MAFDQPLESDQIGDNALISFVTKPILGTLMWIIGDDDDGNANHQEKLLQQGLQDMMMDDDDDDDTNHHGQQRGLPRLARSDVSVGGDRGALDPPSLLPRRSSFSHLLDEDAPVGSMNLNNHNNHSYPQQQPQDKKKMSWSENLVEYMDDESQIHEPPSARSASDSPTSMTRPIKSAMMMTRSTSIRSHSLHTGGVGGGTSQASSCGSDGEGDSERKLRYLPSGLDKAAQNGSLRMPTRPDHYHSHHGTSGHHHHPPGGAAAAAGGGIESPQWGWYINTTPPTPEMFHSRSSLHKHSSERSGSSSSDTSSGASVYDPSNPAARGPNRVFQGLKAGSNRPPIGWPSVPL